MGNDVLGGGKKAGGLFLPNPNIDSEQIDMF